MEGIMSRVVLAMSGGVDSSVAAWLLRRQGHDVIGVFMRHAVQPQAEEGTASAKQGCCTAADAADARRVADRLGIPFYALNFEAEFARIIDYFVAEYAAGRTPNPCIACNTWLKFGTLFQYADSVGAQWVATGHYARIEPEKGTGPICRNGPEAGTMLAWSSHKWGLSPFSPATAGAAGRWSRPGRSSGGAATPAASRS
jgi:tRNA-uridine 2-sulfurtransferase